MEDIKIGNNLKYFYLQKKLKAGIIEISDLTDEELDKMIELYEKQIKEKKVKLNEYRKRICRNLSRKVYRFC